MSTMQAFYDKLQSNDLPKDPDWQKIQQVAHASLDQIIEAPDELSWYFWNVSPEVPA
jgi:hypothetical protein